MTLIRNVWIYLASLILTIYWAGRVVLTARRDPCGLAEFCDEAPRIWSRGVMKVSGVEVVFEGAERIDPDRPQIVVANHSSWFDVFALAAFFPGVYHFVAKQELSRIPIFGPAWIACGHVSIDRSDLNSAVESLDRAAEKIRSENATIIMFPEGTRTSTGELQRFKKGAFVLALKSGVPIVPMAIHGSREIMPKGSWLVRPGTIRITVGEPIPVEEYTLGSRDELVRSARDAVAVLLEETAGPTTEREGLERVRGGAIHRPTVDEASSANEEGDL